MHRKIKANKDKIIEFLKSKGLSKREVSVALLTMSGKTNSQIAKDLGVAIKTIKYHSTNVYKRLGVRYRSQVILAVPFLNFSTKKQKEKEEPQKANAELRGFEIEVIVTRK